MLVSGKPLFITFILLVVTSILTGILLPVLISSDQLSLVAIIVTLCAMVLAAVLFFLYIIESLLKYYFKREGN